MLFAQHRYGTSCDMLMQCWDFPITVIHADSAGHELIAVLELI